MKVEVTDNHLIKLIGENEAEKRLFDEMFEHGVCVFWRVGSELGICSEKQWVSVVPSSGRNLSVSPMLCQESTRLPGELMIDVASGRYPDRYNMPEFLLDSVWCWVHEFSEGAIMHLLSPDLWEKEVEISILGTVKHSRIPHLMVSLHTLSIVGVENEKIVIQPRDFEKYVPWRSKRVR